MSTPNLSVSILTLAIAHAFAAPAFAANDGADAVDTPPASMAEVIVTASKTPAAQRASVGGFADAPLLQTPALHPLIDPSGKPRGCLAPERARQVAKCVVAARCSRATRHRGQRKAPAPFTAP